MEPSLILSNDYGNLLKIVKQVPQTPSQAMRRILPKKALKCVYIIRSDSCPSIKERSQPLVCFSSTLFDSTK